MSNIHWTNNGFLFWLPSLFGSKNGMNRVKILLHWTLGQVCVFVQSFQARGSQGICFCLFYYSLYFLKNGYVNEKKKSVLLKSSACGRKSCSIIYFPNSNKCCVYLWWENQWEADESQLFCFPLVKFCSKTVCQKKQKIHTYLYICTSKIQSKTGIHWSLNTLKHEACVLDACDSFKKCHICFCFVCWQHNDMDMFSVSCLTCKTCWFQADIFSFQSFYGVIRFSTVTHQIFQNITEFMRTPVLPLASLCICKIHYVTMMPSCQAELLYPKKCHFLIFIRGPWMDAWEHLSPLSNGESLWIQTVKTNLSGLDPGTKKSSPLCQKTRIPYASICTAEIRPLSDLSVNSFVYLMLYQGVTLSKMYILKKNVPDRVFFSGLTLFIICLSYCNLFFIAVKSNKRLIFYKWKRE